MFSNGWNCANMRLLYLIFLFILKPVFPCKTYQNYFHITPNFKLSGQLVFITAGTLLSCTHLCMRDDSCIALSYGHPDLVCILHDKTSVASATLIYDNKFTYAAINCAGLKDVLKTSVTKSLFFPSASTTNFVKMQNLITSPLSAFTVCLWIRTSDVNNTGTPFSYSAEKQGGSGNEILLHDYKNFEININGDRRSTNVSANDGMWHHFCFIWQNSDGFWSFYKDGQAKVNGTGFNTGYEIKEGGVLVLGQEQDSDGGGFQTSQSFIGELANCNMWSYVRNANKILQESKSCAYGNLGDLLYWQLAIDNRTGADVQEKINPTCV